MTRAVRAVGLLLLVVGCAAWAWVARLEAPVDRVVARESGPASGLVELELYVLDLRLAPLLVAVAGVGLLVAPVVQRLSHGVLAMSAAAGAALLLPIAAQPLSAWWVGAAVLAVLLGAVVVVTHRRSGPVAPRTTDDGLALPARRVATCVALVLLCSAFPMEAFVDLGDPVLGDLPDGYGVAVPLLQGLLLVAGMTALLIAARRITWLHLVAGCLVLAEMAALVAAGEPAVSMAFAVAVAVAVVVAATAAAVAGERGRVRHPSVGVTTGLTLSYPVFLVPAAAAAFSFGVLPLTLNGGEVDHDGLPIFLTGPFSAALPILMYLLGSGAFSVTEKRHAEGDPEAHPVSPAGAPASWPR